VAIGRGLPHGGHVHHAGGARELRAVHALELAVHIDGEGERQIVARGHAVLLARWR
jgi:hypothetical protein